MVLGQISYVNPEDANKDLWGVPAANSAQSFGNAKYAAELADPWAKYRDNFAALANKWGQDPTSLGALPGVQYQYDKGMDAASRRLQAKGATGGGRLLELMREGQGLAQSTQLPWLNAIGKFGGVDSSSPYGASRQYTEMLTQGQNQRAMAAGNKAAANGLNRASAPVDYSYSAPTVSQPQYSNPTPYNYSFSSLPDPRNMTLEQLNAELYGNSSGNSGYGYISGDGFMTGFTPQGQVNLDDWATQPSSYYDPGYSDWAEDFGNDWGYDINWDE